MSVASARLAREGQVWRTAASSSDELAAATSGPARQRGGQAQVQLRRTVCSRVVTHQAETLERQVIPRDIAQPELFVLAGNCVRLFGVVCHHRSSGGRSKRVSAQASRRTERRTGKKTEGSARRISRVDQGVGRGRGVRGFGEKVAVSRRRMQAAPTTNKVSYKQNQT